MMKTGFVLFRRYDSPDGKGPGFFMYDSERQAFPTLPAAQRRAAEIAQDGSGITDVYVAEIVCRVGRRNDPIEIELPKVLTARSAKAPRPRRRPR